MKGIPNDVTNNKDGRPVIVIKSIEDLKQLQEYKEKEINVRVVIHPKDCTDPYHDILEKLAEIAGHPLKVIQGRLKKENKN